MLESFPNSMRGRPAVARSVENPYSHRGNLFERGLVLDLPAAMMSTKRGILPPQVFQLERASRSGDLAND